MALLLCERQQKWLRVTQRYCQRYRGLHDYGHICYYFYVFYVFSKSKKSWLCTTFYIFLPCFVRFLELCCETARSAILAKAWLLVLSWINIGNLNCLHYSMERKELDRDRRRGSQCRRTIRWRRYWMQPVSASRCAYHVPPRAHQATAWLSPRWSSSLATCRWSPWNHLHRSPTLPGTCHDDSDSDAYFTFTATLCPKKTRDYIFLGNHRTQKMTNFAASSIVNKQR